MEVTKMKYWEIEDSREGNIRITWNESATFNLQSRPWALTLKGLTHGDWTDYHCFTCFGIKTEKEAYAHALDVLKEGICT